MINTAYKGITSSKGLESSKGIQSSTGIKSSGGLKSSTGIKVSGGLDSHLPAPVDLRKTTIRRRNIDDPFDEFFGGSRGGGGGRSVSPFMVAPDGAGNAAIPAAVASYMHKSYLASDVVTVTGLNTPFVLASDTCAWIEIAVDSTLGVTAAELKTSNAFPALVVTSAGAQTQYNLRVGRTVSGFQTGMRGFDFTLPGSPPTKHHWEQLLTEHQILVIRCAGSGAALVATPWQGA